MDAELLLARLEHLDAGIFQQLVLWRVPSPVRGSAHSYKYRFALVAQDVCVLRYDNEAGKGDHRHLGVLQMPYRFVDPATLLDDFDADVSRWLNEYRGR